jgi:hypothetical protein
MLQLNITGVFMSKIEFISHDSFPEDEYTKEIVYLCLEGKYRIAYVRKAAKNGGLFWSVANVGAMRGGQKEFFPAFLQDSNFLEKDIKDFLDKRKWESQNVFQEKPRSMDEVANNDQLPF